MNDWAAPSVADLHELAKLVARYENREYFYDRLQNPEWVPALAQRGVFDDPPTPEIGEDGSVQFPPWPEGRYLARMAPVAPDAVATVLESLSASANPFVTRTLLEAAQPFPTNSSVASRRRLSNGLPPAKRRPVSIASRRRPRTPLPASRAPGRSGRRGRPRSNCCGSSAARMHPTAPQATTSSRLSRNP